MWPLFNKLVDFVQMVINLLNQRMQMLIASMEGKKYFLVKDFDKELTN